MSPSQILTSPLESRPCSRLFDAQGQNSIGYAKRRNPNGVPDQCRWLIAPWQPQAVTGFVLSQPAASIIFSTRLQAPAPAYTAPSQQWLTGQRQRTLYRPPSVCELGHSPVASIGGDGKQLFNPFASYRRDDAELSHVSPDGIDHRGLWRMKSWRVRWSIRQLCCSGVLVSRNRILALITASQMASASVASFFCRLT
jgi:hypothetical protein